MPGFLEFMIRTEILSFVQSVRVHIGINQGRRNNAIVVGKKIGNTGRAIIYTSIGAVAIIALAGFIVSGGLLPNVNKSTYPSQVSDLANISGQVTGPFGLPGIGSSVIAHKIEQLPGTDQRLPDYITNSIVSIDGK